MTETTIYITHRNPGASLPLTIPVSLLVNVPDDVIEANVRANARRLPAHERIKTEAPHDRVAVMCGSGPSIGDYLDDVRRHADGENAFIFAMNGAANFLAKHDIIPDYQVLVDARERTAELIGVARCHLIASQCDPIVFDKLPRAKMWHFINGDLDNQLPEDEPEHAQIGGAGSVGNCALALAWAMGFRRFEIYGYDSSHRDNASHAFHQSLNDFEPWGRFEFGGKEYICSYTMRSQASRFQSVGMALIENGCTVNVHGDGILPDMWRETVRIETAGTLEEREAAKYRLAWDLPDYRIMSPAMQHLDEIREAFGHPTKGMLLDFGCGAGKAAKALQGDGLDVVGLDHVNALEVEIPFRQTALWSLPNPVPAMMPADFGICCDVMEHIPPEKVDAVLDGIARSVDGPVYFSISTVPDMFGAAIGKTLHLTVQPAAWWREQLGARWASVTVIAETDAELRVIVNKRIA